MRDVTLPNPDDLGAALAAVRARLQPTPLVEGWIKAESMQPTGAFKVRGAIAALARLPGREAVVTASAGNHGLGIAWAGRELGREVRIVVPETASTAKTAALEALGVDLIRHGTSYREAEQHALALDGVFVSAYNDCHVIAGQATIGPELPDGPLCVVVPIGGGGLLAGLVLWATVRGSARVIGVEASASPAMSAAVSAGEVVEVDVAPTLADGLAGNLEPGTVTIEAAARADAIVGVDEPEIEQAMRELAFRHGLVAEGAGAVAMAAVLSGRVQAREGERLIVLLTGRNIAPETLAGVLT